LPEIRQLAARWPAVISRNGAERSNDVRSSTIRCRGYGDVRLLRLGLQAYALGIANEFGPHLGYRFCASTRCRTSFSWDATAAGSSTCTGMCSSRRSS